MIAAVAAVACPIPMARVRSTVPATTSTITASRAGP